MTTKGQVTIPKEIRKALDIEPGDEVTFVLEDGQAFMRPVHRRSFSQLHGVLRGQAPHQPTAERAAARRTAVREVMRKLDQ